MSLISGKEMCFQVSPKAFRLDGGVTQKSSSEFQTVGPVTEEARKCHM